MPRLPGETVGTLLQTAILGGGRRGSYNLRLRRPHGEAATRTRTRAMTRTRPLAVFIADDSAPVTEMLRELITVPGKIEIVGHADSQEEVIADVRRIKPDVVILDLQLGKGSGTDVIRAVRASPELAATRVMVISNHTAPQLKAGCLELGADAYFDKVKELANLTDALNRLAEG
jgi:DNA-binding NarL/FixJ family response regulator